MILREESSIENINDFSKSLVEQGYFCLFALKRATISQEINELLKQFRDIILSLSKSDVIWLLKKFIELDIDHKEVLEIFSISSDVDINELIVSKYKYFNDLELISFCDRTPEKSLFRKVAIRTNISDFLVDYLLSKNDKITMQLLLENTNIDLSYEALKEISEHLPNATSTFSKFSDLELKASEDKKNRKNSYYFTNPNKSLTSFCFNYEQNEFSKSKRTISNLFQRNNISEFYLVSLLGKGDFLSFIYGISLLADVPYKMAEDMCTNFFTQDEFIELLESAKFSINNIKLSRLILKLIAKATMDNSLDSQNFKSLIKHQLEFELDIPENLHHMVQYLINLGQS